MWSPEAMQHDAYATLRMKKLICTVLGEFKSNDNTFELSEEERQRFEERMHEFRREPGRASMHNRAGHDPSLDAFNKGNYQLIGTNGDDLRKYIIHWYQEWHPDFKDGGAFRRAGGLFAERDAADQ